MVQIVGAIIAPNQPQDANAGGSNAEVSKEDLV